MMIKHYPNIYKAYCPKIDDDRRIKADLVKVYTDSGRFLENNWTHFNCEDILPVSTSFAARIARSFRRLSMTFVELVF